MDDDLNELNEFRKDVFAVGTLGAVSYVVRGLHDLPGRKSILLVSEVFASTTKPTRCAVICRPSGSSVWLMRRAARPSSSIR